MSQPIRVHDGLGNPITSTNGALDTTATLSVETINLTTAPLAYKGKDYSDTVGASESLTIPSGSTRATFSVEGDDDSAFVEIDGDATIHSPFKITGWSGPVQIDINGAASLAVWVVAGRVNVAFHGAPA